MTPIPSPLFAGRVLPPTTAYAAGLVCEHRPDLADGVRAAVLGDAAVTALDVLARARAKAVDEQGATALNCLRTIVLCSGDAAEALPRLTKALFDFYRWGSLATFGGHDLVIPAMYLHFGFAPCWQHAKTASDIHDLRRVITLHAHTVSLDATVRAAWAKAHLDALGAA